MFEKKCKKNSFVYSWVSERAMSLLQDVRILQFIPELFITKSNKILQLFKYCNNDVRLLEYVYYMIKFDMTDNKTKKNISVKY